MKQKFLRVITRSLIDIKPSKYESFFRFKRLISRVERTAEVMPFWRSGLIVTTLSISIVSVLLIAASIYLSFSSLPREVPLFFNQTTAMWELSLKAYYLFVPIILAAIIVISWRLIYSVFIFDKRLANIGVWTLLLFSLFSLIGISQILSLLII